jgi:hypothetical protein
MGFNSAFKGLIIHSPVTLLSSYVVSNVARVTEYTSIQSTMSIRTEERTGVFIHKHNG